MRLPRSQIGESLSTLITASRTLGASSVGLQSLTRVRPATVKETPALVSGQNITIKDPAFVDSTETRRPSLCQTDVPQATVDMKRIHVMFNGRAHILLLAKIVQAILTWISANPPDELLPANESKTDQTGTKKRHCSRFWNG